MRITTSLEMNKPLNKKLNKPVNKELNKPITENKKQNKPSRRKRNRKRNKLFRADKPLTIKEEKHVVLDEATLPLATTQSDSKKVKRANSFWKQEKETFMKFKKIKEEKHVDEATLPLDTTQGNSKKIKRANIYRKQEKRNFIKFKKRKAEKHADEATLPLATTQGSSKKAKRANIYWKQVKRDFNKFKELEAIKQRVSAENRKQQNLRNLLECVFCFRTYKELQERNEFVITRLECSHNYCHSCIYNWIKRGRHLCPSCGGDMSNILQLLKDIT